MLKYILINVQHIFENSVKDLIKFKVTKKGIGKSLKKLLMKLSNP